MDPDILSAEPADGVSLHGWFRLQQSAQAGVSTKINCAYH